MPNLIGTAPDQVPVNGFLGNMAFQNKEGVITDLLSTTALTVTGAASFAGTIAAGLGSAAAPSYTFIGDTNTGIFSPAADTIAFSEGGIERMRIDSSGNLGVGTSSPSAKLHVSDAVNGKILISGTSTSAELELSAPIPKITFTDTSGGAVDGEIKVDGNAMQIAMNGTERMRIDSSGNVGIGTSSPGQKLTVSGASPFIMVSNTDETQGGIFYEDAQNSGERFQTAFDSGSAAFVFNRIESTGAVTERLRIDSAGLVGIGTATPNTKLAVEGSACEISINDTAGTIAGLRFRTSGSTKGVIQADSTSNLRFSSGSTERMRINSSGFVGIGTSSPQVGIHVSFADQSTNRIRLQNTGSGGGNFDIVGGLAGASNAGLSFYDVTNATTRMYIDASGNVGIGCVPGYRLDVAAADTTVGIGYAARLRSNATATAAGLQFTNSAVSTENGLIACTDAGRITIQGSTDMAFRTNGNERARINSSGNFLVGTTSTALSTTGMYIEPSGRINIGATGTSTYMGFYVNGSIVGTISTNGTITGYNTSSDVRLKDNITDADDASNLIDAIQVRKFDWKADGSHQRYGFVAQELVTVAPEAVSQPEDPDDMMGVDYSKLVPMLIKEVQSLRARVAQLEGN